MAVPQDRGRAAEQVAAGYLELAGLRIQSRNVRLAGVEVDAVALDGATHVVVEVRWRVHAGFGGAAASIDRAKRERLVRAAHALLGQGARRVRIDVIAIDREPDGIRLRHVRNAIEGSIV